MIDELIPSVGQILPEEAVVVLKRAVMRQDKSGPKAPSREAVQAQDPVALD